MSTKHQIADCMWDTTWLAITLQSDIYDSDVQIKPPKYGSDCITTGVNEHLVNSIIFCLLSDKKIISRLVHYFIRSVYVEVSQSYRLSLPP